MTPRKELEFEFVGSVCRGRNTLFYLKQSLLNQKID